MRLALLFGGRSGEHEVSVVSARSVARALAGTGFEVIPMAIDRSGRWADPETAARVLAQSGDRTDRVVRFEGRHRLDPRLAAGEPEVVFPVLHGPWGEDGTVQGLLEMLDLPYVGCGVASSAVCMDKALAKRLLVQSGLATPPWLEIPRQEWRRDHAPLRDAALGLGLPLFVKPARLGSSVGITKVTSAADLGEAVDGALAHDTLAVVERGLEVRELEVAVLGNRSPRASLPGEVVPGREFYDYADKYLEDGCQLLAPAPLDETVTEAARTLATQAYRVLGCEGMARVDLFLERGSGRLWVNEVNTIPGFTSISMYPRLWEVTGLPYPRLVGELVELALERYRERATTGG